MDGVEDAYDICPNTSFSELVDAKGCSVHSLVSLHHYDIIAGLSYGQRDQYTLQENDSYTASLQLDYYYKNFNLQLNLSTYGFEEERGMNDTILGAFYQYSLTQNFSLRLGASLILPTYETGLNNEATDYAGSSELIYTLDKHSFFGGFSHTFVNDKDVDDIIYNDTNSFSLGYAHYFSSQFYASGAYYYSDSIYQNIASIENASAYMYYGIDEHLFITFSYALGLSDSANDHYIGLRFGVYY
ncbi:MAG: DUF3187 domain-containing protein [Campylobacterota bacterium]|nr:DUF3187 domain-containing protein [Campylobacterota bacterium]